MDYNTYEISYETIEILPSYTIITPSDTPTGQGSEVITNVNVDNSEILVIPSISHENDFPMQELVHQTGGESPEEVGTVKSWNCGLCTFR